MDLIERIGFFAHRDAGLFGDPRQRGHERWPGETGFAPEAEAAAVVGGEEAREFGDVAGCAVGREAHDLIFGTKGEEAEVIGDERVEHPEAVLIGLLPEEFQFAVADDPGARGVILALAVDAKKRGARKRRCVKGAGDMRDMMPGKTKLRPGQERARGHRVKAGGALGQEPAERAGEDAAGAAGPVEQRGLKRLFGEDAHVDVRGTEAGDREAVVDGAMGKTAVVLSARETFLLARGDEGAINEQRGVGVVAEIAADTEDDFTGGCRHCRSVFDRCEPVGRKSGWRGNLGKRPCPK